MKKSVLFAALLSIASMSAFATNNNQEVTNNYDQRNYGGNTTNSGGAGGGGGAGGNGYGGSASAGAVAGAAAINKNDIKNTNANVQGQQQGQSQGQGQSQNASSAVKNSGNSSSSSGVKNSGNSAAISNSGGNTQSNAGNNTSTNVAVAGDTYEASKIPVATAYAAGLTSSNGTCMGSSSGGIQGMSIGISVGSTWTDDGCDARYDAVALSAAGQSKAAVARLCERPKIAAAMKAAGTPCPGSAATPAVSSAPADVRPMASNGYSGDDPLIRSRLGLPPLAKK